MEEVLNERKQKILKAIIKTYMAVSYTHLDVYKRQAEDHHNAFHRRCFRGCHSDQR